MTKKSKERSSSFLKKSVAPPARAGSKSFLVLFFKKELLAFPCLP
jgi:hypothetical protein